MTENTEWPAIAYWKSKYDETQQANLALRRDNERLNMKVAELSSTLTELRRDLYWHVERMEKAIHP
jgi:predicted nuclease with TOPRIM domain